MSSSRTKKTGDLTGQTTAQATAQGDGPAAAQAAQAEQAGQDEQAQMTTSATYTYADYAAPSGRMGAYAMSGNFRITNFTGNRVTLQSVEQGFGGSYAFTHGSGVFEMTVGGEAQQALYDAYTNGQPVEWVFLVPKSESARASQTYQPPSVSVGASVGVTEMPGETTTGSATPTPAAATETTETTETAQ